MQPFINKCAKPMVELDSLHGRTHMAYELKIAKLFGLTKRAAGIELLSTGCCATSLILSKRV
jgi:hypothetical protein